MYDMQSKVGCADSVSSAQTVRLLGTHIVTGTFNSIELIVNTINDMLIISCFKLIGLTSSGASFKL